MTTRTRRKPEPVLIDHRKVAALLGKPTRTVREWAETGKLAPVHSRNGVLLFFRKSDVDTYLKTGRWYLGGN